MIQCTSDYMDHCYQTGTLSEGWVRDISHHGGQGVGCLRAAGLSPTLVLELVPSSGWGRLYLRVIPDKRGGVTAAQTSPILKELIGRNVQRLLITITLGHSEGRIGHCKTLRV